MLLRLESKILTHFYTCKNLAVTIPFDEDDCDLITKASSQRWMSYCVFDKSVISAHLHARKMLTEVAWRQWTLLPSNEDWWDLNSGPCFFAGGRKEEQWGSFYPTWTKIGGVRAVLCTSLLTACAKKSHVLGMVHFPISTRKGDMFVRLHSS